jgi:hypothetical protein
MAEYSGHLARAHRLFDGRTVTIRPVRPDDFARERRFLGELSGLSSNATMLRFARGLGFKAEAVPGDLTIRRVVKKL